MESPKEGAPIENGDGKASKVGTAVKDAVKGSFSSIVEFIKNKPLVVIVGLLLTVAVASTVAWIIYMLIKKKVLENRSHVIKETKTPLSGLSLNRCDGSGIPNTANGKRFSFSFWIYIHNLEKNAGLNRHVLHRGDEKTFIGGSPTVILDPSVNKLFIFFDTVSSNPNDIADFSTLTLTDQIHYLAARRGIVVDYVPLQRWVHVGVVVNEDANGGSISSYVDGELVKTSTSNKPIKLPNFSDEIVPSINSLALDRKGDIFVGGSSDAATGVGFSGLVSMIEFFNYNLNANDMYNVYTKGPIHLSAIGKLANMLGIGAITNQYGVRNPVYKKPAINV